MVSVALGQPRRYQREVDGLVLPVSVASQPALDFCNTLAGWNAAEPYEYLVSYPHLTVWAREAGLVDADTAARLCNDAYRDPGAASRQLRAAHALRRALYTACTDAADAAAWEHVSRKARMAARRAMLTADEAPGRRWSIPQIGLERPVLEIARSAGELLATIELGHVSVCPGTGCGWLFLDPRGRRRWCSMEVCGNRAKARRHAERARRSRGQGTGA